ncbi:MAG: bifunctional phosphoribosyl-AMP cyclohydrolase/phosphoribosyl-ATP diphosphatase HisIE [Bacteroidota bacterium]|nr:bifunctional phosphoribosyl-AMP cyclohydrolase/phosphoribosyl-ATP diphosphatase HisIE [Bacteroidota bacterium]
MSKRLDFAKYEHELMPVVVQDATTSVVLMVGFMNPEALKATIETELVTFYSRSQERLWVKGETSHNFLHLEAILHDCDHDTLLIKAKPDGPVCHTGADTCFNETNTSEDFLHALEKTISHRKKHQVEGSYTSSLFKKGLNKIAQKVGEEAVELVIEAKDNNKKLFLNEAADLIYHFLVLLKEKGTQLDEVVEILKERHQR